MSECLKIDLQLGTIIDSKTVLLVLASSLSTSFSSRLRIVDKDFSLLLIRRFTRILSFMPLRVYPSLRISGITMNRIKRYSLPEKVNRLFRIAITRFIPGWLSFCFIVL